MDLAKPVKLATKIFYVVFFLMTKITMGNNIWILLMCALRAHNSKPILEKVYWELKKF